MPLVPHGRDGELDVEPIERGLGPFRGLGKQPYQVRQLLLDPRRNHGEVDVWRTLEGVQPGHDIAQLGLAGGDRDGQ